MKKYILASIFIAFIVGNLLMDFSIDKGELSLLELFSQSQARGEDPTYPNGMDGMCIEGCIYYWSDDGHTIWYGIEITCYTSIPGHHCIFTDCTLGYC